MADCLDTLEAWDWYSLLDASVFQHDSEIASWHSHIPPSLPETTELASLTSEFLVGSKQGSSSISPDMPTVHDALHGSPISSVYDGETRGSSRDLLPGVSLGKPRSPSKKNKRDPRLECPNFLDGRVPCSCPELDAADDIELEEIPRKRPKAAARCQVPSCRGDISHLKGYHQRHRVCLECANSPRVILRDQPHRYCQQCGRFHRQSEFDEGKRSCRRKLEKHNKRRRRPADIGEEKQERLTALAICSSNELKKQLVEDQQVSDALFASALLTEPLRPVDSKNSVENGKSLMDLIIDGSSGVDEMSPSEPSVKATCSSSQPPRAISGDEKRCGGYVSPCPSGRISFKLYDWNPADFPRKLRQQIFEWLGRMPVELEGYIRSGCIILTFFITMPHLAWEMMASHWSENVRVLVASHSSRWGKGHLTAHLNEMMVSVKDGKIFCPDYDGEFAPVLLQVYPISVEAGCSSSVYITGFNMQGLNPRFLFSFGEDYIQCDCCEMVCYKFLPQGEEVSRVKLEIWKITIFLPNPRRFGPAYIEVDSYFGVSNAIPVLVADKEVCIEINSLRSLFGCCQSGFMGVQSVADIVTDLGWMLRYREEHQQMNRSRVMGFLHKRLQCLLIFSIEYNFVAVMKQLLHAAYAMNLMPYTVESFADEANKQQLIYASLAARDLGLKWASEKQHSALTLFLLEDAHIDVASRLLFLNSIGETKAVFRLDAAFTTNLQVTGCQDSQSSNTNFTGLQVVEHERAKMVVQEGNLEEPLWDEKSLVTGSSSIKRRQCRLSNMCAFSSTRRSCRIALTAVTIVTLCGGVCLMLQHSHNVAEVSLSLRRCLWG